MSVQIELKSTAYYISLIRRIIFLLFVLVRLLFEGSVYFIGEPANSNDG